MSIDHRHDRGYSLVELMIALAISGMVAAVVAALIYFSARSFVTMSQYADMNQRSQLALDKMSKEIRKARQVTAHTADSVTLQNPDGSTFSFTYAPKARTLTRIAGGKATTYLIECDSLQFNVFQHTMKSNTFDCHDPAYLNDARVVQMMWRCSREILGAKATTENVQSAKIVLRNR